MRRLSARLGLACLIALLFVAIVMATGLGAVNIGTFEIVQILASKVPVLSRWIHPGWPAPHETIILSIRLPRVVLASLVGASLAMAGAAFQGLFRNPMADPYVIGASSGASLGAAVAVVFGVNLRLMGLAAVPLLAFVGALSTVLLVYRLAGVGRIVPVLTLLLAGIAVSSVLSAVVSFLMFYGDEQLHQLMFWLMGGFSGRHWDYVRMIVPYFLVGTVGISLYARDLNALLLGEESAVHVGVEVEKTKKILVASASLLTAAAVASAGIIGFVGLVVPHVVRILWGPDHRVLVPASALSGAVFLVVADMLARTVMAPLEIPVGILTAISGGPFFIYLLRRSRHQMGVA